jgi:hypothetical protein
VIIAFDSEWWLFPFEKNNPDAMCDCKTKDEITARFEELVYKNRYKTILLARIIRFKLMVGTEGITPGKITCFLLLLSIKIFIYRFPLLVHFTRSLGQHSHALKKWAILYTRT